MMGSMGNQRSMAYNAGSGVFDQGAAVFGQSGAGAPNLAAPNFDQQQQQGQPMFVVELVEWCSRISRMV